MRIERHTLGGMFILVDYFLTAAISCLSGMLYLSVIVKAIGPQSLFLGFPFPCGSPLECCCCSVC